MRYFVTIEGQEHVVDVSASSVLLNGKNSAVDLLRLDDGTVSARVDGRVFDLVVEGDLRTTPDVGVVASGVRLYVKVESERQRAAAGVKRPGAGGGDGTLHAPMPGRVIKVLVAVGDAVTAGQPIVVMEAMKMENELRAKAAGTVREVFVKAGDALESGAKLVSFTP